MQIFERSEEYFSQKTKPLVMALGNFDGVHAGHQDLLARVVQDARKHQGLSAVFTFSVHPQEILHPASRPPRLSCLRHKLFYLSEMGLDLCFLLSFTPEFSKQPPEVFVKNILVDKLNVKKVYLGFNARFGHHRSGDGALMRQMAAQYGFEFEQTEGVSVLGEAVSSSRVRALVQKGKLEEAEACLSRPYSIMAQVEHGDGRGTGLGYPTANLMIDHEVMPPDGVYGVKVRSMKANPSSQNRFQDWLPGPWLRGVMNFGKRPTFHPEKGALRVAEVFILDWQGASLYGEMLEAAFLKKIREERKFESSEALKKQIEWDIRTAKNVFDGKL